MYFDTSLDPISIWLYAERYLMDGTRDYSPFALINEMNPTWHPDSGIKSLKLPTYFIDTSANEKFIYDSAIMSPTLAKFYSPEPDKFLMPIHPETMSLLSPRIQLWINELTVGPVLEVEPTSSSRTLFVQHAYGSGYCPQHFLKLHFPGRISRFFRSLSHEDVICQLWVSKQIQNARLPHLPDLGGGYALSDQKSTMGYLIRSIYPTNGLTNTCITLPGYALFGADKKSPNDPPLLAQLHLHFSETVTDFLLKRIVIPTVSLWVQTVRTLGIIPELHGQNILFSFNCRGSKSSISFRDSDLFVDNYIRKQLEINSIPSQIVASLGNSRLASEKILSLCYDGFLIHHFLAKIAACAKDCFNIPTSVFRDAAISSFRSAGGDTLPMNDTVFYFDERLHAEDNFVLMEQPAFELWR